MPLEILREYLATENRLLTCLVTRESLRYYEGRLDALAFSLRVIELYG